MGIGESRIRRDRAVGWTVGHRTDAVPERRGDFAGVTACGDTVARAGKRSRKGGITVIANLTAGDGGGGSGGTLTARHGDGSDTRDVVRARRERQRRDRDAKITELVERAAASGGPKDRAYWSLVYDLELSPMTTNRAQLAEIEIATPPPDDLDEAGVTRVLGLVVAGLAELQTYLIHTNHLSDRELYTRLAAPVGGILDEPVHEICEGSGGREFIDLAGGAAVDDHALWLTYYATDEERAAARERGEPIPERSSLPFDRDGGLPRPE